MLHLWLRLYAHALLRESQIFPGLELYDESPGCSRNGFADTWKGTHCGELVCIKVIRTQDWAPLMNIGKVRFFYLIGVILSALHTRNIAM